MSRTLTHRRDSWRGFWALVPPFILIDISIVADTIFLPDTIVQEEDITAEATKWVSVPMRILIFALLLSAICTAPHAAEVSPSVEREIAKVLEILGTSDCRFYRNGSWYSASDAQAHLTRKYEYLRKKKVFGSAEDFILDGGTKSSSSGEEYQVQCGHEKSVPSSAWLSAALHRLRSIPAAESSSK